MPPLPTYDSNNLVYRPHYFVLRIDGHLEDVGSNFELCNVDPLAVDIGVVNILAAWSDALVSIVFAVVFWIRALTFVVF